MWLVLPLLMTAVMGLAHPPVDDDDAPLDFGRQLVALACVAVFLLCFSLSPIRQARCHGAGGTSSRNVAGPSLTSSTSIEAPNTPVATVRPWDFSAATNRS